MKNTPESQVTWNNTQREIKEDLTLQHDTNTLLLESRHDYILGRLRAKLDKMESGIHKLISVI